MDNNDHGRGHKETSMRNWTTGPYHFEEGRKQELLPTKKRDSKEFVEKRKSKKERKKESGDWFPVFFLFFFSPFFSLSWKTC